MDVLKLLESMVGPAWSMSQTAPLPLLHSWRHRCHPSAHLIIQSASQKSPQPAEGDVDFSHAFLQQSDVSAGFCLRVSEKALQTGESCPCLGYAALLSPCQSAGRSFHLRRAVSWSMQLVERPANTTISSFCSLGDTWLDETCARMHA